MWIEAAVRYVTLSELIYINGAVLGSEAIMTGRQKVRDIDLLDAAAMRPAASAFGADAFETLEEKAAALLHALARNHPFTDGNKRTATVAALFMLAINGRRAAWDAAEALRVIVDAAENRLDVPALAAWLALEARAPLPEPDRERDAALIAELMAEHRWLLDELQSR
jgi:death-on-curing protein